MRPGLGVHVERRPAALLLALPGSDGAVLSAPTPTGTVLDDFCFHVVSLDRSARRGRRIDDDDPRLHARGWTLPFCWPKA